MNVIRVATGVFALSLLAIARGAPPPSRTANSGMVITVVPTPADDRHAALEATDINVTEGKVSTPVLQIDRLSGDLADMQLFIFLDDSTRSASLSVHLPEMKNFLESLPASTQVAVGYMRNGSVALAQAFTADHQKAADALRLPLAIPGGNGSPYFALSDLSKHWPSQQATHRRAVLMLTDGVDRYFTEPILDDPYVVTAVHDALKQGIMVYSIYLRGSGFYGLGAQATNFAQSRLMQVTGQTGGYSYFEGFTDPVSIARFLKDLQHRLDNQYRVTIEASNNRGVQPVKLRSALPGLKIDGPTRIFVQ